MGAVETVKLIAKYSFIAIGAAVVLYASFLCLLATATVQAHVVYLHEFQMTWFKDLDVPETWGFLRNQATPFSIKAAQGESLYAWHILPLELYRRHEEALTKESCGFVSDFQSRLAFKLLQEDPDARLILHFHGAGGTVGSGYRPPNYRALSAGSPGKTMF
jgi:abhydrolase domain-containing protein 12